MLWYVDRAGAPEPAVSAPEAPEPAPAAGRAFVLLVDSLRFQTAVDPAVMPELGRVAARGASTRLQTVRDAVTVPAVRAALSGRDRFEVLGFVRNFVATKEGVPSVFRDLAARGRRAILYSEDTVAAPFRQDLADYVHLVPSGPDELARQEAQLEEALRRYLAREADLVLYHLTAGDHASHSYDVGTPEYVAAFARIDRMIRRLDDAVPAGESLVVFGDHGHDAKGHHSVGLDVPTYFAARGPGFAVGKDLGGAPILAVRSHLSTALGLPPPPPDDAKPVTGAWHPLAAALFGLAAALWWIGGERIEGGRWPAAAKHVVILAPLVAVLCYFHGQGLAELAQRFWEPSLIRLTRIWAAVLVLATLGALRFGVAPVAFVLLAATSGLGFPTVYRIGNVVTMAPVWLVAAFATTVASFKARRSWLSPVLLVAVFLLVQPFFQSDASNFEFGTFRPFLEELAPPFNWPWAALLVFVRPRLGLGGWAIGLLATAYVWAFSAGLVVDTSVWNGVAGLGLLTAAVWLPRYRGPLLLGGLYVLYMYAVRVEPALRFALINLLAGYRLTLLLVSTLPERHRTEPLTSLFFLLLATLISGWVTLGWGLRRLEWSVLYDFLPAAFVEQYVGWFLPLIMLRYALPLMMALVLLREAADPESEALGRPLAALVGVKAGALLMIALALSVSGTIDQYVEATSQLAIFLTIATGFLFRNALTLRNS